MRPPFRGLSALTQALDLGSPPGAGATSWPLAASLAAWASSRVSASAISTSSRSMGIGRGCHVVSAHAPRLRPKAFASVTLAMTLPPPYALCAHAYR